MLKVNNKDTGNKFEKIAENYLLRHEYKILDRNYYSKRFGEIDIIAMKNNYVIFVEVKGRLNLKYGIGENGITYTKKKHLIKSCRLWLMENNWNDDWQIDVIAINPVERNLSKVLELKHYKNCIHENDY